jgi:hypothetical protein
MPTSRFMLLLFCIVLTCCRSARQTDTEFPPTLLIRLEYIPAWIESMQWRLDIFSDGAVRAEGRSLRRARRRVPAAKLAELQETLGALWELGRWRVWPNGIEDHDQILVILPGKDRRLEYTIDVPLLADCDDASLAAIRRAWRLSLGQVAPTAKCNGSPCSELWSSLKGCE